MALNLALEREPEYNDDMINKPRRDMLMNHTSDDSRQKASYLSLDGKNYNAAFHIEFDQKTGKQTYFSGVRHTENSRKLKLLTDPVDIVDSSPLPMDELPESIRFFVPENTVDGILFDGSGGGGGGGGPVRAGIGLPFTASSRSFLPNGMSLNPTYNSALFNNTMPIRGRGGFINQFDLDQQGSLGPDGRLANTTPFAQIEEARREIQRESDRVVRARETQAQLDAARNQAASRIQTVARTPPRAKPPTRAVRTQPPPATPAPQPAQLDTPPRGSRTNDNFIKSMVGQAIGNGTRSAQAQLDREAQIDTEAQIEAGSSSTDKPVPDENFHGLAMRAFPQSFAFRDRYKTLLMLFGTGNFIDDRLVDLSVRKKITLKQGNESVANKLIQSDKALIDIAIKSYFNKLIQKPSVRKQLFSLLGTTLNIDNSYIKKYLLTNDGKNSTTLFESLKNQ